MCSSLRNGSLSLGFFYVTDASHITMIEKIRRLSVDVYIYATCSPQDP